MVRAAAEGKARSIRLIWPASECDDTEYPHMGKTKCAVRQTISSASVLPAWEMDLFAREILTKGTVPHASFVIE